jgi:DNA replication protein DnaC
MNKTISDDAALAAIGAASRELQLTKIRADAARLADVAQRQHSSYLGFLAEVLSVEVDHRTERRKQRRIIEAKFPRIKRLADFELSSSPVPAAAVATLANGGY